MKNLLIGFEVLIFGSSLLFLMVNVIYEFTLGELLTFKFYLFI